FGRGEEKPRMAKLRGCVGSGEQRSDRWLVQSAADDYPRQRDAPHPLPEYCEPTIFPDASISNVVRHDRSTVKVGRRAGLWAAAPALPPPGAGGGSIGARRCS